MKRLKACKFFSVSRKRNHCIMYTAPSDRHALIQSPPKHLKLTWKQCQYCNYLCKGCLNWKPLTVKKADFHFDLRVHTWSSTYCPQYAQHQVLVEKQKCSHWHILFSVLVPIFCFLSSNWTTFWVIYFFVVVCRTFWNNFHSLLITFIRRELGR